MSLEKLLILLFRPVQKYMRAILIVCTVNLGGFGLSGCGFEPLYAERNAPGLSTLFTTIQIQQANNSPDNDTNRAVYSALSKTLRPEGKPAYRLDIWAEENKTGALMDNNSREARTRFTLKIRYSLYDIAKGKVVTNGTASASTSFNVDISEYANLIALESAQSRAANAVSEKIVLQLANWHKSQAQ